MDKIFQYVKRTRTRFTDLVNKLSLEQLNTIPDGFRNNIIWNYGHIVVSTQGLCYLRTQVVKDRSSVRFLSTYQKGSKPERWIDIAEIEELKLLSATTIERLMTDYKQGFFENITPFATDSYGYEMNSIEEVITCSLAHDNMHYGYALAQNKLVNHQNKLK